MGLFPLLLPLLKHRKNNISANLRGINCDKVISISSRAYCSFFSLGCKIYRNLCLRFCIQKKLATLKFSPLCEKYSLLFHVVLIRLTASVNLFILSIHFGHPSVKKLLSFTAFPEPTPSLNLPGNKLSIVAVAFPIVSGWQRPPIREVTRTPALMYFLLFSARHKSN